MLKRGLVQLLKLQSPGLGCLSIIYIEYPNFLIRTQAKELRE